MTCGARTAETPTAEELERLAWLGAEDHVLSRTILPPCQREGSSLDWWKERHVSCTGGEHKASGLVVICACECHRDRVPVVLPGPLVVERN